ADLAQRLPELPGEGRAVVLAPAPEAADVAGADTELLVEGLAVSGFREVILLRLRDLVVARVGLVRGRDPPGLLLRGRLRFRHAGEHNAGRTRCLAPGGGSPGMITVRNANERR